MAQKDNEKEYFTNAQIKLLIETRLKYEGEFIGGRKSKSVLWRKVLEEIQCVAPDFHYNKDQIHRKFLNIMITYKRIKNRNKETGRDATTWEHFDRLDEIYGTKHSIQPPVQNLISSILTPSNIATNQTQNSLDSLPSSYDLTFTETSLSSTQEYLSFSEVFFEESYEAHDAITPNKRRRKTKENETLEFLRQEAKREDERHVEVMELERKKLDTEVQRIQEMRDLKTVLQQMLQNKNSN